MHRGLPLVVAWLFAAGCGKTDCSCQRYELVSTSQGLYKLDRQTGETWLIDQQHTFQVYSTEETARDLVERSSPPAAPNTTAPPNP